jgi:hypothetical protein
MSVKHGERTQHSAHAVIAAHLASPVRTQRHLRRRKRKRPESTRCISDRDIDYTTTIAVRDAGPLTPYSPRAQGCPGKHFLSRNKALRRLSFVALVGMRDTA